MRTETVPTRRGFLGSALSLAAVPAATPPPGESAPQPRDDAPLPPVRSLDCDLVLALHQERGRTLSRLRRLRAAKEWARIVEDGREPLSIPDWNNKSVRHWLIGQGLTRFADLAACGEDELAGDDATDDEGERRQYRERKLPVTCPRCLKLMLLVCDSSTATELDADVEVEP